MSKHCWISVVHTLIALIAVFLYNHARDVYKNEESFPPVAVWVLFCIVSGLVVAIQAAENDN